MPSLNNALVSDMVSDSHLLLAVSPMSAVPTCLLKANSAALTAGGVMRATCISYLYWIVRIEIDYVTRLAI